MDAKDRLAKITGRYGLEMHANLAEEPEEVEVIPSGILSFDAAMCIPLARCNGKLVIGGYPRGRLAEIFGPEGGGKTTMAMAHMVEVAKMHGTGIYIDVEQKGNPYYFKQIFEYQGADASHIEIIKPPHAEAVWEVVREMAPVVDSIVIDSLADMITKARLDADVGEQQPGMLARITQDGLKKSKLWETDCVLLLINQVREKIGGYSKWPETTPGGHHRLHKSVLRARISRTTAFKKDGKDIGIGVRAKVHKNQLGKPDEEALFRLYWGKGVDRQGDMIEAARVLGLLQQSGSWYYLPYENAAGITEEDKVQGTNGIREAFDQHPEMYEQLGEKLAQLVQTGAID